MDPGLSFSFFLFILMLFSTHNIHACIPAERKSLLSFALSLSSDSSPSFNWTSTNCCNWEGITCNRHGLVTHLELPSKELKLKGGIFPSSSVASLTHLTHLNLSSNKFSGSIPSSICHHSSSSLRHLDFSFNSFNGSIPLGFGKCSKLEVFRAGYNNLSGLLPRDVFDVTTLEEIWLARNAFYGEMSEGFANLTKLTTLDMSYNSLSGVLPQYLGRLSNLKHILLDFNFLRGSLLPLMNCTSLVELRIGSNNLEGDISMLDFSRLGQIVKLDLRKNNVSGVLPKSLYSCKSLRAIRVGYNNLEFQIQPEIVSLKALKFLSLGWNRRLTNVTGAMKILMNCKGLVVLSLACSFPGETLPTDLSMVGFDGFHNLRILDLTFCNLTGQIPSWLSKLKRLEILDMSHNRITGSFPSWMGNLPRLYSIFMESNLLSGELPKELWTLPMLVSEQTAAKVNRTSIELPIFYPSDDHAIPFQYNYLLYAPSLIYLHNNRLSGRIPAEIGQLQLLQMLDLSKNNFSGNIPDQISNLKHMEELDLSMNHLSGEIPASLTSLNFLSRFNVSYNNLQGQIPSSTQLQGFDASAYQGNPKLCGPPLTTECQKSDNSDAHNKEKQDADTKEHRIPWFYVSVILGFIVGFWGFCGPLVLIKKWRYAYYQFLDSAQDRFYMMIGKLMASIKRRFS